METKLSDKDTDSGSDEDINTTTTYYFYGNGLNAQDNGKDYFVYHFNNVGSTMAVADAGGSVVETYNYTPYGELIDGEYREDIPFLYNGQYGVTTDGNGLYDMRTRYYNVEIKRFINQDVLLGVLEWISSLNRYAYVEGNPISYLDPFGLDRVDTGVLHDIFFIISGVGTILSHIPVPTIAGIGEAITLTANCLDTALYFYDIIMDIKNGDTTSALGHTCSLILNLIAMVGLPMGANSYKNKAIDAMNYECSTGWMNYNIMQYDKLDNFYPEVLTAAQSIVTIIEKMIDIATEFLDL